MKISLEEIVMNNIKKIDIYTEFLNNNFVQLNIKIQYISDDKYNSKIYDLYKCYLNKKYIGDNFKIIHHYINSFFRNKRTIKLEYKNELLNDYSMDNLKITFHNGKELNINIPLLYKGFESPQIIKCLTSTNYKNIKNKVFSQINELLFNYYTHFNIKNFVIFNSDSISVDISTKKSLEKNDSLYVFFNDNFDSDILKLIFDDFLDSNIQLIDKLKVTREKMTCHFNNGNTFEGTTNLKIIKDRVDEIENVFLDNNSYKLRLKI